MPRVTRPVDGPRTRWTLGVLVIGVAALLSFTAWGRAFTGRFVASLRINRPQSVAVSIPAAPGAGYPLQEILSGVLADSASATHDEPEQSARTPADASAIAGFSVQVPSTRHEPPRIAVGGARDLTIKVDRSRLLTILAEAGMRDVSVSPTVQGATVAVHTPRVVRLEYGHCPVAAVGTLASQIQGPLPLPEQVADCIRLTEARAAVVDIPAGLPSEKLVEIALELSGLSPERAAAFQRRFDWHATLTMSLPRSVRSFDSVAVNGASGLLFSSGGRRGPAYVLIWMKDGLVFSLTGYGNVADAVPLAASIR